MSRGFSIWGKCRVRFLGDLRFGANVASGNSGIRDLGQMWGKISQGFAIWSKCGMRFLGDLRFGANAEQDFSGICDLGQM